MDKNKVSVSQITLLLMLVLAGGKFLSLPSILSADVGHDSWLVVSFNFFLDGICLCFLLWAIKSNKHRLGLDFILDKTLSPIVSKITLAVFFVLFITRIIVLLENCYNTFSVIFDVTTNWIMFLLPILVVAGFAIARGFTAIARVGEILFGLVFLSIVIIAVYPVSKAEFSELLPIAEVGVGKILKTSFLRCHWFSDYVFVYFVMENIKPQKRIFSPVLVGFAVGAGLTVLLNAVFVALFGSLAPYKSIAMVKLGLFSVSESTNGRWDWLTFTIWITSVILKIIIYAFCAYKCVEKIFGFRFSKTNFPIVGIMGVFMLTPMFVSIDVFRETFMFWCVVPFAVVQYVLPLALPFLTKSANGKLREIREVGLS